MIQQAIDHADPTPLYHQLKRLIQQRIDCGDLKPGDLLPPDKDLEKQYRLSRITVRQALGDLAREGYLTRGRGRPTAVAHPKYSDERIHWLGGLLGDLRSQGNAARVKVLSACRVPATARVAAALGIPEGQLVVVTRRLAYVDDEPIAVITDHLNAPDGLEVAAAELERFISIYDYLEQRHGIRFGRGDKTLEAVVVNDEEARLLHMKSGSPVFLAQTVAFDIDGAPRLFIKASYRGDRYKYHVALHRPAPGKRALAQELTSADAGDSPRGSAGLASGG